ncbi:hypothetical protein J4771_02410 [Candidatus Kaistella beijingensis]|uniref:hypothetical protein n=1 Tax=Candidatus Kaistella beijingensis TaxID=2820270 RepID=UPI001CC6CB1A|nr:hypothetical protein [Candidatus Kaistella beijingensis]UBB90229.1 hypothetical protein J4771_02410 [Candidatus Kaistella beijingensis]
MNYDFIKINNITDLIGKFNLSWFSTITLTFATPLIEQFLPIITQIVLFFSIQLIAFFVDFARLKWLSEKRNSTIKQVKEEIQIESETMEDEQ